MKTVWFYIKQMFLPFMYTLFAMMIALGILCIEDKNLTWLKVVLLLANLGLLSFILWVNSMREGEKGLKVRIANDVERKNIILTGEDRPLNLIAEYKPWKGFVIAGVSCLPLIILLIIHTILAFIVTPPSTVVGGLASFLYMCIFGFFFMDTGVTLAATSFYVTLLYVPYIMAVIGVPYYLGGKKIEAQQRKIAEKHKEIYGEDF